MTIVGVDVSSWQPATFPTAGLAFAIVKATEYTDYENPEYASQLACARNAGLVAGHYHFARSTDAAAEVAYFASKADVRPGDLIALDWEESSVTPAARDAWLQAAKARYPENRVILYCDVSFWDSLDPTHYAADGLWIADYNGGTQPNISQPWVFWQYSSAGNLDHSYGKFNSQADLVAWAHALAPSPVPPPPPTENPYQWRATHNHYTPLAVDGNFGQHSAEALQYVVGTTVDGNWGPDSIRHLQAMLGVPVDGQQGPETVKALQRKVGATVDGNWGPQTTRDVQSALNRGSLY